MTGSPVFRFNSNSIKNHKIQRKLNFAKDQPRNSSQSVDDSETRTNVAINAGITESQPADRRSSESFVFEGVRGVKRKLDFDAENSSDKHSSLRFSNHNISLCGLQSRNSSLLDVKSIRSRLQDSTRSSIASTCRRRLFDEHEPDAKRARFESPVLACKTKKKEVKLSLQKKFPGLPSSEATRSGLMLNLALSKYNMLNDENEEDVSIGFVDESQNMNKSTNKQDYVYCSSVKKKENETSRSPVFRAIKKVRRRLDLEDHDRVNSRTGLQSSQTSDIQSGQKSEAIVSPTLRTKSTDADKSAKDMLKNLTIRSALKNDTNRNLSNTFSSNRGHRSDDYYRRKLDVHLSRSSSDQRKYDRIVVGASVDGKSSKNCSVGNSLIRKKQIEIRRSLCERRREMYFNHRMNQYLKDCVSAAEEGFIEPEIDQAFNRNIETSESRITNVSDKSSEKNAVESNNKDIEVNLTENDDSNDQQPAKMNLLIENVESQESRNDFIIENATSQEIKQNCVEEIELFIENESSQEMNETNVGIDTADNTIESCIVDETLNNCSQSNENIAKDMKVDEVSSPEISPYEYQTFDNRTEAASSEKTNTNQESRIEILDSSKKRARKKKDPMNLVNRLERLLNREKSDARMWQYELSKMDENCERKTEKPGVFRVEKMWKEFSRLILVCSLAKKNSSNCSFGFAELDDSGVEVSNTVIVVMDPEDCPKSLTYSSIFRMHPPWEILYLEDLDRVFLLRPKKLEIISNDAHLCEDLNLQSNPSVLQTKCYCSCVDACDCNLPEGYLTIMKPLLSTDVDSRRSKRYLKHYNAECFKSSCITDLILKHRLYANDRLYIDLRVIHAHNGIRSNEFWYLVCEDEKRDVCCVVVEGRKMNFTVVDKTTVLRFIGIVPWKWIPAKSVRAFAEFVKLVDVSGTGTTMGADRLCVFVMFEQSACIECLDSTPQR